MTSRLVRRAVPLGLCLSLGGCFADEVLLVRAPQPYFRDAAFVPFDADAEGRCGSVGCRHRAGDRRRTARATAPAGRTPPRIDVAETCRASAKFATQSDRNFCLTDEHAARVVLDKKWATFKPEDRRTCLEQTRSFNPSYVETLTCLEIAGNTMMATVAGTPSKVAGPNSDPEITGSIKARPKLPDAEPPLKPVVVPP